MPIRDNIGKGSVYWSGNHKWTVFCWMWYDIGAAKLAGVPFSLAM